MALKERKFPDNFKGFSERLIGRVEKEDLVYRSNESTWDLFARRKISQLVKETAAEEFGEGSRKSVYVEGEGYHLKEKLGDRYKTLFDSPIYPDIAILGQWLAIELDHTGKDKSKVGAKFRNVLAKSAFNTLCGTWEACLVLFFNENPRQFQVDGETELELLDHYKAKFATNVVVLNLDKETQRYTSNKLSRA